MPHEKTYLDLPDVALDQDELLKEGEVLDDVHPAHVFNNDLDPGDILGFTEILACQMIEVFLER